MSQSREKSIILVDEDSFLIGMQLKEDLEDLGFAVAGPAPNVASALQLIEQHKLSCAVLDVNLGDEDSTPIGQALRKAAIPFLFITGYASVAIDPDLFGGQVVLNKPVEIGEIHQALLKLKPNLGGAAN